MLLSACNTQSIHISSDHWLPPGLLSLPPSSSLSLARSFPLFVYHVEVDLCRLHLAELGGVGEIQQLEGERAGERRRRRSWNEKGQMGVMYHEWGERRKGDAKGWIRRVSQEGEILGWRRRLCEETGEEVLDWPQVSRSDLYLLWCLFMSEHKVSHCGPCGSMAPVVSLFTPTF